MGRRDAKRAGRQEERREAKRRKTRVGERGEGGGWKRPRGPDGVFCVPCPPDSECLLVREACDGSKSRPGTTAGGRLP